MHRISIAADGRKSLLAMLKPRHDGFFKYRSLFTGSVDSVDEGTVLLYVEHDFSLSPSAAENCAGTVEGLLRSTTQRLAITLKVCCSQLMSLG